MKAIVAQQPPKSLRTLTNVTDIHYSFKSVKAIQELAHFNAPFVKAAVVVE